MKIFDLKDYLSIEEMIDYIDFNKNDKLSKKNAITLIKDLVREDRLELAIWYKGKIVEETSIYSSDEEGGIHTDTDYSNGFFNGQYIFIDNEHILSLLAKPKAEQAKIPIKDFEDGKLYFKSSFKEFNDEFNLKNNIVCEGVKYSSFFIDSESYFLEIDDLRISKESLDKLLGKTDFQKQLDDKNMRIAELEKQLETLSSQLENDNLSNLSNVERFNFNKSVIARSNYHLAHLLKQLDYTNTLSKNDVAQTIISYMEDMALLLSHSYKTKIDSLLVTSETIKTRHMTGLNFKSGAPSKTDIEKERIDLIFDKTKLPIL